MPDDAVAVVVVVVVVPVVIVVEVTVTAIGVTPTPVDDAAPAPAPVAVGPGVRGAGPGVPGALSFCARFVALPKPRSLPINPPPGVPGVTLPPFPAPVSLLSIPVFAPAPGAPVDGPLSSCTVGTGVGTGVAPAPPFDTDGRRVGGVK